MFYVFDPQESLVLASKGEACLVNRLVSESLEQMLIPHLRDSMIYYFVFTSQGGRSNLLFFVLILGRKINKHLNRIATFLTDVRNSQ